MSELDDIIGSETNFNVAASQILLAVNECFVDVNRPSKTGLEMASFHMVMNF